MLCMVGGFTPERGLRTGLSHHDPLHHAPAEPAALGVCTFAHVPVQLGGPGGEGKLDTNLPEYEWLNRTHAVWFTARSYKLRDEPRQWDWSIRSCYRENRTCRYIQRVCGSQSFFRKRAAPAIPVPPVGRPQ